MDCSGFVGIPHIDGHQRNPGANRRSRRAYPQSQERRRHAAAALAHRHDRRQRIGQVVARLRHHLCRRAAALCRVAVGLRPPVSRTDGEARRRQHRGDLSRDRDPPEEQHPQSALDGRHHHGDSRLPAPSLRAYRPHVLPVVRQGSDPRNRRGRREQTQRASRKHTATDRLRHADRNGGPARDGRAGGRRGRSRRRSRGRRSRPAAAGAAGSGRPDRRNDRGAAAQGVSAGSTSTVKPSISRTSTPRRSRIDRCCR